MTIEPSQGSNQAHERLEQVLRGLARFGLIDTLTAPGDPTLVVHPVIAAAGRAHLFSQDEDASRNIVLAVAASLMAADSGATAEGDGRLDARWHRGHRARSAANADDGSSGG